MTSHSIIDKSHKGWAEKARHKTIILHKHIEFDIVSKVILLIISWSRCWLCLLCKDPLSWTLMICVLYVCIYAYVHVYIHIFSFAENLPLSRFFNPSPSNAFFYPILKYKCSEDMILPLLLFSIETGAMNAY